MTVGRRALWWPLFVLICMGLGYPALNRYDPTKLEGTSDVGEYRDIVMGRTPQRAAEGGAYARIARSENFSRVLVSVGCRLTLNAATALLGATLFLLNFVVANHNLVGLIDSGEGCFVMAIVWSLLTGRWFLLPIWGVFGALAKETFAPLSALLALGWWLSEARRGHIQLSCLAWICALPVASLTPVTIAMTTAAGGLIWPWQFAGHMGAGAGFLAGLRGCILNHTFWYVFIWLLPLGVLRLLRLPRPWVLGSALAFCGASAMGAYNNALGNTTRALFNVAGPILSLSTAIFLAGPTRAAEQRGHGGTRGPEEHTS